jgi:hypothetical protein
MGELLGVSMKRDRSWLQVTACRKNVAALLTARKMPTPDKFPGQIDYALNSL